MDLFLGMFGFPVSGNQIYTDSVPDSAMFCVTNQDKYLGSSYLLFPDILSRIADKLDSDFLILPSSIHEFIILKNDGKKDPRKIQKEVKEINEDQVVVKKEYILTNSVYRYRKDQGKLEIAVNGKTV